MRQKRIVNKNESAVSPIIGVILMVVIATSISSTVYVYSNNLLVMKRSPPKMSIGMLKTDGVSENQLKIVSTNGEGLKWEDIIITADNSGVVLYPHSGAVKAGDRIICPDWPSTVSIIYSPANSLISDYEFTGTRVPPAPPANNKPDFLDYLGTYVINGNFVYIIVQIFNVKETHTFNKISLLFPSVTPPNKDFDVTTFVVSDNVLTTKNYREWNTLTTPVTKTKANIFFDGVHWTDFPFDHSIELKTGTYAMVAKINFGYVTYLSASQYADIITFIDLIIPTIDPKFQQNSVPILWDADKNSLTIYSGPWYQLIKNGLEMKIE